MLKEVICENIPMFPDMEITFKNGTLKLEAKYYIRGLAINAIAHWLGRIWLERCGYLGIRYSLNTTQSMI